MRKANPDLPWTKVDRPRLGSNRRRPPGPTRLIISKRTTNRRETIEVSRSRVMNEPIPELKHFGGIARLFPLPNVVLFPNLLQALHIFEPRYRQMTEDALAADRMIAMVLLRPGW